MKNKTLWLFIGCCAVPLVGAYAALKLDWLPKGTTNQGEFVAGEKHLSALKQENGKLWTIVLNSPSGCLSDCDAQKATLPALYTALGKLQKDVDIAVLGQSDDTLPFAEYEEDSTLQPAHLYLVDHKGLVVLKYPYANDPEENRLIQKGLLKDLKKLLSYARSS
ncbi:transmembrane cytochrome oxidase associated protein [Pseudoalteromonas luteoviolacea B = ATCC 29581]|nr:transmembrane cytochrome oxidase associated protein [Pseudoalteromonas luteoviolacea B = ATCC 29581]